MEIEKKGIEDNQEDHLQNESDQNPLIKATIS